MRLPAMATIRDHGSLRTQLRVKRICILVDSAGSGCERIRRDSVVWKRRGIIAHIAEGSAGDGGCCNGMVDRGARA